MNEDDPQGLFDPLWYDRAEPEAPASLALNAAAFLLLLLMIGAGIAVRVYWLPDTVWCWSARFIARGPRARNGRS